MEKQKKSFGTIALVVLLLVVTVVSLVLATYAWAKYSTTQTNNASANVAKWNVTLSSNDTLFVGQYQHVVDGEIAPGTSGSFQVAINGLSDTEVCVAYEVLLNNVNPNTIGHLKFFRDAAYTSEIKPGVTADGANVAFSGTIDLDDHNSGNAATDHSTIGAAGTVSEGTLTKTIYWVWPYDRADALAKSSTAYANVEATDVEYDQADTTVGRTIDSLTLNFTVKAWQVTPGPNTESNS